MEIVAVQGAINATEQLAEISLGLRKTFDLTSLISAMATAALDTGLNANGQGYHQTRSVGICYPNDYDPGWEAFKDLISQLDPKMSVKSTSAKKTPTRREKKSSSLESYWGAAISGLPISPSDALKIALAAPGWLENLEDATEFYFKYMDGGWPASALQAPTNSTHPGFFSSVGSYLAV